MPTLPGGGLNITEPGGHLDVHIDGNYHDATGLNRRVNIILYLNRNWDESWGGDFCLYSADGKTLIKKVAPVFNRLLIFDTNDLSFHGSPDPLAAPDGVNRKSLILYYYTKDPRPENENIFKKPHSALWMSKGLKDKKGKQERDILNES